MNFLFDIEKQEALKNASDVLSGSGMNTRLFGDSKQEIRDKSQKNLLMLGGISALIILMLMMKKR